MNGYSSAYSVHMFTSLYEESGCILAIVELRMPACKFPTYMHIAQLVPA